jgi:hypothetical protein
MTATVQKDGACEIKIAVPFGGTLEVLGYTRNGADASQDTHMTDVPGDENGGDEGPPIDIQHFGDVWHITLELTKFDRAVLKKIQRRIPSATTDGTPAAPGTLTFASGDVFRVLLNSPTEPMNFLRCVPRSAIEFNKGTKWMTARVSFDCYKNASGIIHNAVTT